MLSNSTRRPLTLGLALMAGSLGGLPAAQAQPSPAIADPIEGVWESSVTQHNCTTQAVTLSFKGTQAYHRGGQFTAVNSASPATSGPGFGFWFRNADGSYTARFRHFRFSADGSYTGTIAATRTVTLAADGKTTNATAAGEVRDAAGNLVAAICSEDVARRME